MICGLRDVGAIPTMLPAQAAALATTEATLNRILLVNGFAAFRCTVELRSTNQGLHGCSPSPTLHTQVQQACASALELTIGKYPESRWAAVRWRTLEEGA